MGRPLTDRAAGPSWSSAWVEFPSPSPLRSVVEAVWSGRAGRDGEMRVFPDGCTDLTWDGERLRSVSAVSALVVQLHRDRPADGVRLRCGAARAVLGGDVPLGVVDLRDLSRPRPVLALERALRAERHDAARRRALLLRWVSDRIDEPGDSCRGERPLWVDSVVDSLAAAGSSTREVAARHGLSTRSLQREVRAATGMSPKTLSVVLRLRRLVVEAVPAVATGGARWGEVAVELGYADQSHLGRECRAVLATTPASLVRAWRCARRDVAGRTAP